jgi:hypothetical protein
MEEMPINDLEMSSSKQRGVIHTAPVITLPVAPFLEEPEMVVQQTSHDSNDATTRNDVTKGSSSSGGWSSRRRHALTTMEKHCRSITVAPKLVMLAYLIWYMVVVLLIDHSDSSPFVDAIVIMILIGLVLNANAYLTFMASSSSSHDENNDNHHPTNDHDSNALPNKSGGGKVLWAYLRTNFWSVLRLFLIPYAVSSYAGVASSAVEGTFVSVFPTDPAIWGPALGGALGFPISLLMTRSFLAFYLHPNTPHNDH